MRDISQSEFLVTAQILLCVTKKLSDIAIVGYSVIPLIAKQFFGRLIHHFGYSKVAADNVANSCIEEFILDIAKWLYSSEGLLAWQTFCAVCISNTLQPLDSSTNRGRQTFTEVDTI